jgi:myo-inositol 2-dehydrogenase/D-chiro-inositol 1-dehydrogenase
MSEVKETAMQNEPSESGSSSHVTRREFVKTTTAVAAVGAFTAPNFGHAQGSETLRVGLIGCGGRGTGATDNALNADPGVVLYAMGDVFADRLDSSLSNLQQRHAERVRVPESRRFLGFDAYQQVIDSGVDVVILATPPHFRPEHLRAAVAAGKHIFSEKPMAVDAPGVRSVLETAAAADAKGVCLMSGFCWRYSLPERATYEQIHDGAIGDVVSVHTTYHTSPLGTRPRQDGWSEMEFQLRNWQHMTWLSGDHIVEQACHSIDKINWAMQGVMPTKVTALGGRLMRKGEERGDVYDHFSVIYEYDDGARCFHTCRQMPHCSNDNTDYIMGTKGNCYVNGWGPTHVIRGENRWRYRGPKKNMYQVEHDELFAAIRSGERINDGVFMANSSMMSIIGRMAAYSGQTIRWEDALNSTERLGPETYAFGDLPTPEVKMPGSYTVT